MKKIFAMLGLFLFVFAVTMLNSNSNVVATDLKPADYDLPVVIED